MSAKSENTDLNTVVVLSDNENGARAGKSRLDGLNEVLSGEVSVVGDYKEGLESEFKEENVGEAKEVKMEDNSLKESVKEEKGLVLESQVCVVNVDLGSSSSDCVEGAILKEVSLEAERGEKGFAVKEINPIENSDNLVSGAKVEVGPDLESHKLEELVANERIKEVSIGAEMDKMGVSESEINAVEDSGAKLDETSCSRTLEVEKENKDFSEKEKEDSLEAETDKKDFADVERKAVEDSGAKLDETSRSQSLEAEQGKENFADKETEKDKIDPADVESKADEDSGTKLDETSRLQSLEAEKEKEEIGRNENEITLEAEENKKDFAELERKAVEDSDPKLEALPCVSEVVGPKSMEVAESTGNVPFVEGETKVNPDECAPKSNADDTLGMKLEALPCASEDMEPEPVEATESVRESTDDFMAVDGEVKVEFLPQKGSEVVGASGGLQNGASESGSDSIGIVIDLNPKKGKGKGASKKSNAKPVPSKHGFSFGDLIWGKVRSHPWWPAQICDPLAASKKAKKYFKRDTYLIAYYGDNTFAWNEASRMKPFAAHFSQLEKQSHTEDFCYAVDCALEEVSRRVEFGLACSCLSEEVYSQIKTQTIVNAGIREELSTMGGGDTSLTAASFQPLKLVEYIKELARSPNGGADDRLEFVVSRSELLAVSRWKGYTELPEFSALGLILESDTDMSVASEEKQCDESIPEKGKSGARSSSSVKRKLESSASPAKKKKNVSDLMLEKRVKTPTTRENGSKSKASGKKRKAIADSPVKEAKSSAAEVDSKPLPVKQSFRIGERISKVASQLNASSPILKNGVGKCKSSEPPQTSTKEEKTSTEGSKPGKVVEAAVDEVLPQISSDRSRENSLSSDGDEDKQSLEDLFGGKKRAGKKLAKRGKKPKRKGIPDLPHELGQTSESYWSARIGKSIPEDQDDIGEALLGKSKSPELESDSEEKISGENLNENKSDDGLFVTALILNFSGLDSVPSRASLNKIFGSYESLDESKTEVLKNNRAKVVFKKRSDAETAFSSAGKYSTFGRSLVSYRLKYMSSSPPNSKKPSNKDK